MGKDSSRSPTASLKRHEELVTVPTQDQERDGGWEPAGLSSLVTVHTFDFSELMFTANLI